LSLKSIDCCRLNWQSGLLRTEAPQGDSIECFWSSGSAACLSSLMNTLAWTRTSNCEQVPLLAFTWARFPAAPKIVSRISGLFEAVVVSDAAAGNSVNYSRLTFTYSVPFTVGACAAPSCLVSLFEEWAELSLGCVELMFWTSVLHK